MRYLVFGTGAVGGLVGGRLALAGHPVTFLARPRLADILEREGLRIGGAGPSGWLERPTVVRDLAQVFTQRELPDLILLTVKAYDCEAAAVSLAAATPNPPPVVCLLNGIGNEATLASQLGEERVIPAVLTTAVLMPEAGQVRVERERGLDLAVGHPLLSRLQADLAGAGMPPRLHQDGQRMKWSKLLTNIVSNATSAILGWSPRAVFSHPGVYRLELEALREVVRVMAGLGYAPEGLTGVSVQLLSWALGLPPWLSQPLLRQAVASGRGGKKPSFHYDIGRGRSEVRWLNGAVAREAARLGLPAPANTVLTDTMLELVESRLPPAAYADQPGALLALAERAGVPGIRGYNPGAI